MNVRVASAAVLVAVVALLAVLSTTGCGGSRPDTIEDLFADIADLNSRNEMGKIWDLYTDDARQREIDKIESAREYWRRNPDPKQKLTNQFKSTREEFMRLDYVELFRRENIGNERALIDAKIVDKQPDPRRPGETVLSVVTPAGDKVFMTGRKTSRGWELVEFKVIPRRAL